jgi:hypothetical protein
MQLATSSAALSSNGETGSLPTSSTQPVLKPWLRAQALNLGRHTAALHDFRRDEFGTGAEAPSEGHILAVNKLLGRLRVGLVGRARRMNQLVRSTTAGSGRDRLTPIVTHKHLSHVWVQRIERIWDFYLELFGQRQSAFGAWLLSADRIALDCYQAAYLGVGRQKSVPAPPPFCYMRTGFGPATYRRGIRLQRLGRELNPFPLIQLPYHRLINPWTLGAILHEVSHNLQSDLGLSRSVPLAIGRQLLRAGFGMDIAKIWVRWNRETFADLSAVLLGGPAVVASLMDVVGRAPQITLLFTATGVHPTPYIRVLISVELLRRMGFKEEAEKLGRAWRTLYPDPRAGNFPSKFLHTAPEATSVVVDTICYRSFKDLGDKPLGRVFQFAQKEQRMIEESSRRLAEGTDPGILPARFLIGAARFALDNRLAGAEAIKKSFYNELVRR